MTRFFEEMDQKTLVVVYLFSISIAASPQDDWHYSGENIALHKIATQLPETYFDDDQTQKFYPASLAVDGNTDSDFKHGTCSHTMGKSSVNASWTVDLGRKYNITGIVLYNRDDLKIRLQNFQIYGDNFALIHDSAGSKEYNKSILTFKLDGLRSFSTITVLLPRQHGYSEGGNYYLTLCEVKMYAAPRPACDVRSTYVTNGQTQIQGNTGRLIDDRYTVGTSLKVTCNDNFHAEGHVLFMCLQTGKYDYPIPKCIEACVPILTPSNGHVFPDLLLYMVNTSLKIICDVGYETIGTDTIQCQSGGRWETPIPTCQRVQCVLPKTPEHGRYSEVGHVEIQEQLSSKLPYLSEIIGLCDTGYVNLYPQKRICKSDKTWSDHETICLPIQCTHPQNRTNARDCVTVMCTWPLRLANGFYQASNSPTPYGMPYNTTLTARCNNMYKLSDNYSIRRCNEDAAWDNKPAICYPMCPLPSVTNGQFINALSTQFKVGTALRFTCDPGFSSGSTEDTITCQKNHRWNMTPVCQDQMCALPSVTNGQFINALSTQFKIGTTLRFTCDPGFTSGSSKATITCQQTLEWSATPECHESETTNTAVIYGIVSTSAVLAIALIVGAVVYIIKRRNNDEDRVEIVHEEEPVDIRNYLASRAPSHRRY